MGGERGRLNTCITNSYVAPTSTIVPPFFRYHPQTMVSAFMVSPKTYLELKSSSDTLQASSTYA